MGPLERIQVLAFREVTRETPTLEYFYRRVFRWYSKTFAIDVRVVPDLPLDDVLQAYFEETYEGMSDEERMVALQELVKDPEELAAATDRKSIV